MLLCGPEASASEVLGWRRLPSISFILTENKSFSSYAGRGHMCALAGSKTREGQATKKMHASLNSKDRKRTRTRGPEAKPQPPAAPADGVGGGGKGALPLDADESVLLRPTRAGKHPPPAPPSAPRAGYAGSGFGATGRGTPSPGGQSAKGGGAFVKAAARRGGSSGLRGAGSVAADED